MTDTYRALCAELVDIVTAHANPDDDAVGYVAAVLTRARAALAAEPEPPADGEVATLVGCLHDLARADWLSDETADILTRAADLLERLASPACVTLKPSPEQIEAFKAAGYGRIEPMERLALQLVPEGPSEEELMELRRSGDWLSSYNDFISISRAVLARWGRP